MKLIQVSTPSCYYCSVSRQYTEPRLKENYEYLDLSKEDGKLKSSKYLNKEKGFPQFYFVDNEGKVLDKWIGWSQVDVDRVIKTITDINNDL